MHILTKFLVVAAAILSVLLSGMSITYAANVSKVKSELANEKARTALAQVAANESNAELGRLNAGLLAENSAITTEREKLESDRDQMKSRIATLQAEVNKLQLLTVTHEARIDEFRAVIETNTEIMKVQSDELVRVREDLVRKTQREIELTDRVSVLDAQIAALTASNRNLLERLAEAQSGGSGAVGGGTAARPAPAGFRAQVSGVQSSPTGSDLIEINAGSSDGLAENMKLDIVRNGSWVAAVVVSRVDLNESIARIDFISQGSAVRAGDTVQSRK
ncbi:MAG: hypothetical protein H6812_06350 [Phycisphaeraceae bacterium]|nr:hypothetical protein [Phycisphaerales bacterium]MCB9842865.1 hypothetical protein [Phycisphaeraceae bacterium]